MEWYQWGFLLGGPILAFVCAYKLGELRGWERGLQEGFLRARSSSNWTGN